jgi:hypothetical protein
MSARVAHSLHEMLESLGELRDYVESAAYNLQSVQDSAVDDPLPGSASRGVANAIDSLNRARSSLWEMRGIMFSACAALDRPGSGLPTDAELIRYLDSVAGIKPTR